jgi:hypothetical protein
VRTKHFRENGARVNKMQFVLGMLFWLTHGLSDESGFVLIKRDETLAKVMPVSRELVDYGYREGDMTKGRTLIRNSIAQAAKSLTVSELCL